MLLLQKVYAVDAPDDFIDFEVPVKLSHTSFIDNANQELKMSAMREAARRPKI